MKIISVCTFPSSMIEYEETSHFFTNFLLFAVIAKGNKIHFMKINLNFIVYSFYLHSSLETIDF